MTSFYSIFIYLRTAVPYRTADRKTGRCCSLLLLCRNLPPPVLIAVPQVAGVGAAMGKKSKKNAGSRAKAKAKAGGSSSAAAAAPSALSAAAPSAAAATLTTSGMFDARNGNGFESSNVGDREAGVLAIGGTAGSKKLKCVRCCCALKDLAKAHQCPGCAQLYCWRCEKKAFRECLNGKNCVDPLRRCMDCTGGRTMAKLSGKPFLFDAGGILTIDRSDYQGMVELIAKDERLSDAAIHFKTCSSPKCLWDKAVADEQGRRWRNPSECYPCYSVTDTLRSSYFRKCSQCIHMRCTMCHEDENERVLAFVRDFRDRNRTDDYSATSLLADLRSEFDRALVRCNVCEKDICIRCNTTDVKREGVMHFDFENNRFHTTCPPCTEKKYWSAKPCTNPTCPNEVGVPTKRCGGCHIDRCCSVECQGMAFPAHKGRCLAISTKRAAAAGK